MRKLSLLLLSLAFSYLLFPSASAAFLASDGSVIDKPLQENVYATGGTVRVTAPIEGDVVVFAGDVYIEAPIKGDVIAAGGLVTINNAVEGDLRVASSKLIIENAHVAGDIVYFGSQIALGAQSTASGALLAQSGQAILLGSTSREVSVTAAEMNFGGTHKGPVHLVGDTIQFFGNTKVAGELSYRAGSVIDAAGVSAGKLIVEKDEPLSAWQVANSFLFMFGFISGMSLILACLLMVINPVWSLTVTTRMRKSIATSLLLGIFTIFAVPSLLGFLLTAQIVAAPWALVLLPLFLVLSAGYILLLTFSPGMIALLFARLLPTVKGKPLPTWVAIPVGSLCTGLLFSLCFLFQSIGLLMLIVILGYGVGAMVQTETAYLGVIPKGKKQ